MFWEWGDHAECARHRGWVLDRGFERRTCTVANPRALRHALRHALCHGVGQAGGDPGSVNSLLLQPDPNAPGSLTESVHVPGRSVRRVHPSQPRGVHEVVAEGARSGCSRRRARDRQTQSTFPYVLESSASTFLALSRGRRRVTSISDSSPARPERRTWTSSVSEVLTSPPRRLVASKCSRGTRLAGSGRE